MLTSPHKRWKEQAHSRHPSETMAQIPKGPTRKATLVILDSNAFRVNKIAHTHPG